MKKRTYLLMILFSLGVTCFDNHVIQADQTDQNPLNALLLPVGDNTNPLRSTYPTNKNSHDTQGRTLLTHAIQTGNLSAVQQLVNIVHFNINHPVDKKALEDINSIVTTKFVNNIPKKYISPGIEYFEGQMLLKAAAIPTNTTAIIQYINLGVNPNLRDRWGKSPLTYAVEQGNAQLVKLMAPKVNFDKINNPFDKRAFNRVLAIQKLIQNKKNFNNP